MNLIEKALYTEARRLMDDSSIELDNELVIACVELIEEIEFELADPHFNPDHDYI